MEEVKQNIESDEISVKDIIIKGKEIGEFLLRKWSIIIIAGLIGASIGVYKAWLFKPHYIARLTFTLENEKSNPLGAYSGLASMAGIDLGGGGEMFSSDNIMSMMSSRKIVVNTLLSPISINNKKTTLIEYYLSFNHINDKWNKNTKLTKLKFPLNMNPKLLSRDQDSLLTNIYSSLIETVININKPNKKTSFKEATCTSTNELFSKILLETLSTQVTDFYIQTKTKRQKENVDILQKRADSLYMVLSNSMYRGARLADQNINITKQVAGVDRQKKQIDQQVASTAYTQVISNLEMAKITLQKETPLIQVIDKPVFPLEKVKASRLKGLLVGGFLAGFVAIGFLLAQRFYKKMVAKE